MQQAAPPPLPSAITSLSTSWTSQFYLQRTFSSGYDNFGWIVELNCYQGCIRPKRAIMSHTHGRLKNKFAMHRRGKFKIASKSIFFRSPGRSNSISFLMGLCREIPWVMRHSWNFPTCLFDWIGIRRFVSLLIIHPRISGIKIPRPSLICWFMFPSLERFSLTVNVHLFSPSDFPADSLNNGNSS